MRNCPLLTREKFKEVTLARCGGLCCVPGCGRPAKDAHHIIERDLWHNEGYFEFNGAPLCSEHHLDAESTTISVEELRKWCGITEFRLPVQFADGDVIDKWGNYIHPNGTRSRGELFHREGVQKSLARGGFLDLVSHHTKHPRTWHLSYSPGATSDDKMHADDGVFAGMSVVVLEKFDGENTNFYSDYWHTRSLNSHGGHVSRDWVSQYWSSIKQDIPDLWRLALESMYAVHSIKYDDLPAWILGYQIWDENSRCLEWGETVEWFGMIGSSIGQPIPVVPVLYEGIYDRKKIMEAWQNLLEHDRKVAAETGKPIQEREGFVVRNAGSFHIRDFKNNVAKWVRSNHVQTDQHWMKGPVVRNGLAKKM